LSITPTVFLRRNRLREADSSLIRLRAGLDPSTLERAAERDRPRTDPKWNADRIGGDLFWTSEIPKKYAAGLEISCPDGALSQTGALKSPATEHEQ
jgi:hypothetical protein